MQQQGIALTGRGEDLNAALAELFPFATNVDRVLAVLNHESAATSTLLRDTGIVFSSLSASPSQLQGFIRNSNATFAATAAQDVALAATIRAFPAYLIQTRSTINRLTRFAATTKPLIDELRPAAVQLSPALQGTVDARARAAHPDGRPRSADQRREDGSPGARELPRRQRPVARAGEAVSRWACAGDRLHQHLPA